MRGGAPLHPLQCKTLMDCLFQIGTVTGQHSFSHEQSQLVANMSHS